MATVTEQKPWELLSYEEKNLRLFLRQKALLKTFLETGALSKEQYDKSFHDLTEKMERKLCRVSEERNCSETPADAGSEVSYRSIMTV